MRTQTRTHGIIRVAAILAAVLLLASCSSSHDDSPGAGSTGSLSFSLQMPQTKAFAVGFKAPSIACDELGIVTVEAYVYDENHELIATGGPWECNAGSGMIYAVKAGTNRSVEVLLKGGDGAVRYRGGATGVTVYAGRTTDLGILEIIPEEDDNEPPAASSDHAYVNQGGVVSVLTSGASSLLQNDFDPEGRGLTISTAPVAAPLHGSLAINSDGTFRYTHDGSSSPSDSFTYRISDPEGASATAVVTIAVVPGPPNTDPVLSEGVVSPEKGMTGTTYTYTVHYLDADASIPESVQVVIDGSPRAMALFTGSAADGVYRLQTTLPLGGHTYAFTCSDGHGGSASYPRTEAYAGPYVFPDDHTPIAANDRTYVNRGGVVSVLDSGLTSVLGNDSPPAGATLAVSTQPVRPPAHGSLVLYGNGTFRYTHDSTAGTYDSFTYLVTDGRGGTDVATVSIEVMNEPNSEPALSEAAVSPDTGDTSTLFTFAVHYVDPDNNPPAAVTVLIDGTPHAMAFLAGTGTPADGVYQYQTALPVGTLSHAFSCDDGHGGTDALPSSGTITGPVVVPANRSPVALDDSLNLIRGGNAGVLDSGRASVLANDSDPDGQALTVSTTPVSGPSHGTVVLNPDGTFLYTHDGTDTIADSFAYGVSDGHGGVDTAMVHITVYPGDDVSPVLTNPQVSPGIGDVNDLFAFSVRYFDPSGGTPTAATVVIDGVARTMSLCKGSPSSGTYVLKTALSTGLHTYSFSFVSPTGRTCRYPAVGTLEGPVVLASIGKFHVAPAPAGSDANDGSPSRPFATIGRAASAAEATPERPAVIRIAAGTYRESVFLASWESLEGGWNASFTTRWDFLADGVSPTEEFETIIEAPSGRCITVSSAEGVVIEGVTVRGRQIPDSLTGSGGVLIDSCSPTLRYCRLAGNFAPPEGSGSGAGMQIQFGNPLVDCCQFAGNQAGGAEVSYGGALCTLFSSPSIIGCVFRDNHAGGLMGAGGAVYSCAGSPLIRNCVFSGNSAWGDYAMGGAVYSNDSATALANCVFIGNASSGSLYGYGGAMFNEASRPAVTGCTFTRNAAYSPTGSASGGAVFNDGNSSLTIFNSILWADSAILSPEISVSGTVWAGYSDIDQEGFSSALRNIRSDPSFSDPENADLHLLAGSPCIDAGSAAAPSLPVEDLDGLPRIVGGLPDMGAFEKQR